jgi:hypothetical protein
MLGWLAGFILLGYLLPHFIVSLLPSQDLKKKARTHASAAATTLSPRLTGGARTTPRPRRDTQYDAKWALVTGASSGASRRAGVASLCAARSPAPCAPRATHVPRRRAGIGKSLAQKLALQGLNVVLVALDVRADVATPRAFTQSNAERAHRPRSRDAPRNAQEPLLDDTFKQFKAAFPKLEFRKARRVRRGAVPACVRSLQPPSRCVLTRRARRTRRWASTWARRART